MYHWLPILALFSAPFAPQSPPIDNLEWPAWHPAFSIVYRQPERCGSKFVQVDFIWGLCLCTIGCPYWRSFPPPLPPNHHLSIILSGQRGTRLFPSYIDNLSAVAQNSYRWISFGDSVYVPLVAHIGALFRPLCPPITTYR